VATSSASALTNKTVFRPRARLLALLGDQLIGKDILAIFELVKNAYDADSSFVKVILRGLNEGDPRITVEDDGEGMDLWTIRNIWLQPGDDHKFLQRREGQRTRKFKRLPLGEKGVGRFAVHKLGRKIVLNTRKKGGSEFRIDIDWDEFLRTKYLDEAEVPIRRISPPKRFTGDHHGTRIVIRNLRKQAWTRGEIRDLQRSITSISSPFARRSAFRAHLVIPERPDWLDDLPSSPELLELAPWHFSFLLKGEKFSWKYEFRPPRTQKKIIGREDGKTNDQLLLPREPGSSKPVVADEKLTKGIGEIRGKFVAYDRDRKVLGLIGQSSLVKEFLGYQSGVRVYRDGIRVYNYGEPTDDWLNLDLRRVNRPTERLSRNIIVGEVNLDLEQSTALLEKTNREGFDENETYARFKIAVTAAISKFEVERDIDKDRWKKLLKENPDSFSIAVEKPIADLRKAISKFGGQVEETLTPYVNNIEQEYHEIQELLLKAGMAGLNFAVIFHEIERALRTLYESIRTGSRSQLLELQAQQLMRMFEGIAGLLRTKKREKVNIRELVQSAFEISKRRFERHQIAVKYELPDEKNEFEVRGSFDLLLGTVTNLIDNSLYWLRVRWPNTTSDEKLQRRLYIGVSDDIPGGRSLVVADNGPGFQDDPDLLTRPFFTRRPDGMGLGLYYASLVMQLSGGELKFPDRNDLALPGYIDGAVIAMYFPDKRK
jgi:signal transduction histidine kinase